MEHPDKRNLKSCNLMDPEPHYSTCVAQPGGVERAELGVDEWEEEHRPDQASSEVFTCSSMHALS